MPRLLDPLDTLAFHSKNHELERFILPGNPYICTVCTQYRDKHMVNTYRPTTKKLGWLRDRCAEANHLDTLDIHGHQWTLWKPATWVNRPKILHPGTRLASSSARMANKKVNNKKMTALKASVQVILRHPGVEYLSDHVLGGWYGLHPFTIQRWRESTEGLRTLRNRKGGAGTKPEDLGIYDLYPEGDDRCLPMVCRPEYWVTQRPEWRLSLYWLSILTTGRSWPWMDKYAGYDPHTSTDLVNSDGSIIKDGALDWHRAKMSRPYPNT